MHPTLASTSRKPESPRAPGSSRNFTGGWPHCVSPLGGLGTFSRAWFKDSRCAVLGLMDLGTKALKENHLGSKSSEVCPE